METFGSGLEDGPPLPPGTTTYNYVDGGPQQPNDGNYTISSRTNYFDWFDTTDHTPGDINGKSLIINASFTPGEFFRISVDGLCENTSYEFSSWLMNLHPSTSPGCDFNGLPINVRFQIWDNTDSNLLASGDTGNIFDKSSPIWEQYALVFQTLPGQTSVILKMLNNGEGGCGNDLAIDDIAFRTCGDNIKLTDTSENNTIALCAEDAPISTTLFATPDFSVYSTHAYQWQESLDRETWTDIPFETNSSFTTPSLNSTRFYRVKVAEDPINLANDKCNAVSDIFDIIIEDSPAPPISFGDVGLCSGEFGQVVVSVDSAIRVDWYDSPIDGDLLAVDSPSYETETSGTYYAEAITKIAGCKSEIRTPVSITYFDLPQLEDEFLQVCQNSGISINADIPNLNYLWSTGADSFEIIVSSGGVYTVAVTDSNGCSATKTIEIEEIVTPSISSVISKHRDIIINTSQITDFEYSLDGITYQKEAVFQNMPGGSYTVYVRGNDNCAVVTQNIRHIVVPRFFTPNGDGFNDFFEPEGTIPDESFKIEVYTRLSQLVFESSNQNFQWDGRFQGQDLPASDYWYNIQIGSFVQTGHFALIR